MSQFDQVSVVKKANVYFDGKCVSHTVQFADGTKKSVGVILPSTLTFNTGAPEVMETIAGACKVRFRFVAVSPDASCTGVPRRTLHASPTHGSPDHSSSDCPVVLRVRT